ncbi:hypothetical protein, partial [Streptomyces sp. McG7]|uniref:hypothetical protein n=1 Tax=Streptomyces sp. McG7 TaxID=2725486 RepID=UPI001BE9F3B3
MSATLGVATMAYAPYAFLNYFGVIIAVICGYTGLGIARQKPASPTPPWACSPRPTMPTRP